MAQTPTDEIHAPQACAETRPRSAADSHPIMWFARRPGGVREGLADAPTWSMTTAEQRETLVLLHRLAARTAELELRVLAQADRSEVAADTAARSTASWLAHETTQDHAVAHQRVKLARALD